MQLLMRKKLILRSCTAKSLRLWPWSTAVIPCLWISLIPGHLELSKRLLSLFGFKEIKAASFREYRGLSEAFLNADQISASWSYLCYLGINTGWTTISTDLQCLPALLDSRIHSTSASYSPAETLWTDFLSWPPPLCFLPLSLTTIPNQGAQPCIITLSTLLLFLSPGVGKLVKRLLKTCPSRAQAMVNWPDHWRN